MSGHPVRHRIVLVERVVIPGRQYSVMPLIRSDDVLLKFASCYWRRGFGVVVGSLLERE